MNLSPPQMIYPSRRKAAIVVAACKSAVRDDVILLFLEEEPLYGDMFAVFPGSFDYTGDEKEDLSMVCWLKKEARWLMEQRSGLFMMTCGCCSYLELRNV